MDACKASTKPVAAESFKALDALSGIAIRVHDVMTLKKTLGRNGIDFAIRMYMRLEFMSEARVLHTGPQPMTAFESAIALFGPNVPGYVIDLTKDSSTSSSTSSTKKRAGKKGQDGKPKFCCWYCGSLEHYVSNKAHPDRSKLEQATKDLILKCIADAGQTDALKAEEVKKVKAYWSRLSL